MTPGGYWGAWAIRETGGFVSMYEGAHSTDGVTLVVIKTLNHKANSSGVENLNQVVLFWSNNTMTTIGIGSMASSLNGTIFEWDKYYFNENTQTWEEGTQFSKAGYRSCYFPSKTYKGQTDGYLGRELVLASLLDTSNPWHGFLRHNRAETYCSTKFEKTVDLGNSELYGMKAVVLSDMDYSSVVLDMDNVTFSDPAIKSSQFGSVNACDSSADQSVTPSFSYTLSDTNSYTDSTTNSYSYSKTYKEDTSVTVKYEYKLVQSRVLLLHLKALAILGPHQQEQLLCNWSFYVYEVTVAVPYSGCVTLTYSDGSTAKEYVESSYTLYAQYASDLVATDEMSERVRVNE
eukprot:Nk52_evm10s2011 gene=Nk52_evmTU10s2011